MKACKVIQAQSKAMKQTQFTSRGGGADHVRFQGTKKRPEEVQELNALVANAVSELLIHNKCVKAAAAHNSGSEDETENFNFKISTSGKNDNNLLESRKINRKCKENHGVDKGIK